MILRAFVQEIARAIVWPAGVAPSTDFVGRDCTEHRALAA
jgi:hypothetical protein